MENWFSELGIFVVVFFGGAGAFVIAGGGLDPHCWRTSIKNETKFLWPFLLNILVSSEIKMSRVLRILIVA